MGILGEEGRRISWARARRPSGDSSRGSANSYVRAMTPRFVRAGRPSSRNVRHPSPTRGGVPTHSRPVSPSVMTVPFEVPTMLSGVCLIRAFQVPRQAHGSTPRTALGNVGGRDMKDGHSEITPTREVATRTSLTACRFQVCNFLNVHSPRTTTTLLIRASHNGTRSHCLSVPGGHAQPVRVFPWPSVPGTRSNLRRFPPMFDAHTPACMVPRGPSGIWRGRDRDTRPTVPTVPHPSSPWRPAGAVWATAHG